LTVSKTDLAARLVGVLVIKLLQELKKDVDDRDEWQTTLLDARRRMMMMIAEKYRES